MTGKTYLCQNLNKNFLMRWSRHLPHHHPLVSPLISKQVTFLWSFRQPMRGWVRTRCHYYCSHPSCCFLRCEILVYSKSCAGTVLDPLSSVIPPGWDAAFWAASSCLNWVWTPLPSNGTCPLTLLGTGVSIGFVKKRFVIVFVVIILRRDATGHRPGFSAFAKAACCLNHKLIK